MAEDEPTEAEFCARWQAAQDEGRRIQAAIDKGFLVMDGEKRLMNMKVTDEGVFEEDGRARYFWFWNKREYDNGYYTPVEKIREQFRRVKFYVEVKEYSAPAEVTINVALVEKMLGHAVDWDKTDWTEAERGMVDAPQVQISRCPRCNAETAVPERHETYCRLTEHE